MERVRAQYSQLREIEHGFRVLKHTLASRPVFHWTERRVRAHLAICCLAFALLRLLRHRYRLAHPGRPAPSEERLPEELEEVQSSPVHDPGSKRDFAPAGPDHRGTAPHLRRGGSEAARPHRAGAEVPPPPVTAPATRKPSR